MPVTLPEHARLTVDPMDRNALITGTADAAAAAAAVLTQRGWKVVGESSAAGPVNCYVQMPVGYQGLSARVDLLAGVASRLGDDATVLLAVDDEAHPADLLAAMARVVLEDAGHADARISVIPAAALTG